MTDIKEKIKQPKDICSKCGSKYDDILGIGYCGKCFDIIKQLYYPKPPKTSI